MTMMVLAIRLYDIGERDEAVFWFYAAKARTIVLLEVLDMPQSGLAQGEDTVLSITRRTPRPSRHGARRTMPMASSAGSNGASRCCSVPARAMRLQIFCPSFAPAVRDS
jgi:hypothetical protein